MVLFVDLEEENEPPERFHPHAGRWPARPGENQISHAVPRSLGAGGSLGVASLVLSFKNANASEGISKERENPNKNSVTQALGCYPVIMSIASHIDLNTLDALARTCRQVRVNLLQFRTQLLTSTLHCENEDIELDPGHTFRYRARAADWYYPDSGRDATGNGKVGDCARDMVAECRRCEKVVCRNCTIKSPPPTLLQHRHRRICKACSKAPLEALVLPKANALDQSKLKDHICACPSTGVWLCQPCGRSLRSADEDYQSIWKWRTRYLPSLGGLGAGIGEGDRGVPCGRGGDCVAAREVEQEIDCDAEDARGSDRDSRAGSPSSGSSYGSHSHSHLHQHSGYHGGHHGGGGYYGSSSGTGGISTPGREGPGYMRHEIEGIGGVVKKKIITMVRVGACVTEWGDEKSQGKFLVREIEGRSRSWCGWCWRVVPAQKDLAE